MKTLAVTVGEPAGIGPDLIVHWLLGLKPQTVSCAYEIFAPESLILERAQSVGVSLKAHLQQLPITFVGIPLARPVIAGQLDTHNVPFVLESLQQAVQACLNRHCQGLITAPIHKAHINQAGIPFTGHTGYLETACQCKHSLMLFVADTLKVALTTIHIPLSQVPKALTPQKLEDSIRLLSQDLQRWFGIAHPKLAILGLNPHAGENGYLGTEEISIQKPVITKLRQQGFDLSDPIPADTAFNPEISKKYDALLAMYHDQGLAPIKTLGFGQAVNVTLGLPFIRTSVDHGTALTLAGTRQVNAYGFQRAADLAATLSDTGNSFHA